MSVRTTTYLPLFLESTTCHLNVFETIVGWSGYLCFLKTETSVRRLNNPVSSMHYYPKTSSQLPCFFWAKFSQIWCAKLTRHENRGLILYLGFCSVKFVAHNNFNWIIYATSNLTWVKLDTLFGKYLRLFFKTCSTELQVHYKANEIASEKWRWGQHSSSTFI